MFDSRPYSSIAALLACFCVAAFTSDDFAYEYAEEPEEHSTLPRLQNLAADGARARELGVPLMLAFSTRWCEFCKALEQQVLEPMLKSGEYDDRVLLRKVMVDDHESVIGFNGRRISTSQLGLKAGVELYPTIVFFDASGNEVGERIVGITVFDYIPRKIDRALVLASRQLSSTRTGVMDQAVLSFLRTSGR